MIERFSIAVAFGLFVQPTISMASPLPEKHPFSRCFVEPSYVSFPNQTVLAKASRGFNLPDWDKPRVDQNRKVSTLSNLNGRGMSHVRLPVFNEALYDAKSSDKADNYLVSLRQKLDQLIGLGYVVSIDFHPGGDFHAYYREFPLLGRERLVAAWQRLVTVARDYSAKDVLVEILNEPDIGTALWAQEVRVLAELIRTELPEHTIVVGAAGPSRFETLAEKEPLKDPNIIYAFHFYDPFYFTHQGASWHRENDPIRALSGVPFPTSLDHPLMIDVMDSLEKQKRFDVISFLEQQLQKPATIMALRDAFNDVHRWSVKHNRPVILNEFGVLADQAPLASRLLWISTVRILSEARCFGWAHWDYDLGFGFIDPRTGKPDTTILHGLLNDQ